MILDRIVAQKKLELDEMKRLVPFAELKVKCGLLIQNGTGQYGQQAEFASGLRKDGEVALIAEIKKASPSKGLIRSSFDHLEIAQIYTASGASAISVLTDREFFQGSPNYLSDVSKTTDLPLLRKDFMIDPYQLFEAKLLGADAVLLIMAILTDGQAAELIEYAVFLGLECLVEVHTEHELERALGLEVKLIGINNRNLQTFKTDLETTFRLKEMITDNEVTVISESGINTREDVLRLKEHGIHAMLVGEALMRETDIAAKIRQLLGNPMI
ncbi:indole-3-glycerol phosphate synthase TrpC [Phosphitispora fastidiosa]|uniref:indole-3-glycerol phosphate synthase TrpC n=1 Tax=Phosphitispora fastidiosa TaxID=2837202 RepID=UPI001E6504B4|nr:indole-3-glycerol phosphate synthase [Phosphitispora fastidiosa]